MAARTPFELEDVTPLGAEKGALALVDFETFRTCAAYFPQLHHKTPFFHRCMELAKEYADTPFLIVSDLNTGRNDCDLEPGATEFSCSDSFIGLESEAGLIDL